MAENSSVVNRQLLFDTDGATPVPAAKVLVGLKRGGGGANHIQSVAQRRPSSISSLSPHKRKNHTHQKSPIHKRGSRPSEDLEMDREEDSMSSPPLKRSRRVLNRSRPQPNQSDGESWNRQIKTFLRLPKALTWCRYEWFCADIDRPFLRGENDFSRCLNDMFPNLRPTTLSVMQWRVLRRMIGKPRRCSRVFFAEERTLLAEKRRMLRDLQKKIHQGTLTLTDFTNLSDLPDNIPAVLTVGTKVTVWLSVERDKGFHTGTVEAVDLDSNHYWVTFDKPEIGKHSVPDTDLQSLHPCEMISLSSLEAAHTSRHVSTSSATLPLSSPPYTSSDIGTKLESHSSEIPDPLLPSSPLVPRGRALDQQLQQQQSLGGFPTDLLRQVVQMSKLLGLKQDRVRRISLLNKDAERMHARHLPLSQQFQKHYATVVIDLDDINRQLNVRSEAVKRYCAELGYQDEPYQLSSAQECMTHAREIINTSNERLRATGSEVVSEDTLTLISKLTSLLLQIELLSQEGRSLDLTGLQNSISETLSLIHTDNHKIFQKHIETPLALIQSGMNPSDSLHPFSVAVARKPSRTNSCFSPKRTK